MRKISVVFLQVVIILIGITILLLMLWEPQLEGRNVNATFSQIYFNDPFLAYAYTGSLAFFFGLSQTFKILGNIRKDKAFSPENIKALGKIKYCALILIAFVAGAEAYAWMVIRGKDDIAGGVALSLIIILISLTAYAAADVFEKLLKKINN